MLDQLIIPAAGLTILTAFFYTRAHIIVKYQQLLGLLNRIKPDVEEDTSAKTRKELTNSRKRYVDTAAGKLEFRTNKRYR